MGLKDKIAMKIAPLTSGIKSVPVNFRVSNAFITAVENLQREMSINSRSEAIRVLAEVAIEELTAEDSSPPKTELSDEMKNEFMALRKKFSLSNQDLRRLIMHSWIELK